MGISEVVKFQKDSWHGTLFMFGTIHFPYANKLDDELYFSLVGVKEDNQTFKIARRESGPNDRCVIGRVITFGQ